MITRLKLRHAQVSALHLCSLLGTTEQNYYYHLRRGKQRTAAYELIVEKVQQIRTELPGVGAPKLRHLVLLEPELKALCPGRDKFYDLLRRHALLLTHKGRPGRRTTNSKGWFHRYPNLIKELIVNRPNALWTRDITYVSTYTGFCYLSLITDAYSHRIMGAHLHTDLTSSGFYPLYFGRMNIKHYFFVPQKQSLRQSSIALLSILPSMHFY